MKNRAFWAFLALCCASVVFIGRVGAQDDEDEGCGCDCGCGCEEMDEGCGEEEAGGMGMPAWMNLTAEHKALAKMAGEWNAEVDFTPMGMGKTKGRATTKVILGGRFVQQEFVGEMMNNRFEGLLHMGYDTVGKQYVSTWMDSMTPYLYVSRGPEKNGEIRMVGKEPDPTGTRMVDSTTVTRWNGNDQYTVTFFSTMTGKEMKTGSITYTRRK